MSRWKDRGWRERKTDRGGMPDKEWQLRSEESGGSACFYVRSGKIWGEGILHHRSGPIRRLGVDVRRECPSNSGVNTMAATVSSQTRKIFRPTRSLLNRLAAFLNERNTDTHTAFASYIILVCIVQYKRSISFEFSKYQSLGSKIPKMTSKSHIKIYAKKCSVNKRSLWKYEDNKRMEATDEVLGICVSESSWYCSLSALTLEKQSLLSWFWGLFRTAWSPLLFSEKILPKEKY